MSAAKAMHTLEVTCSIDPRGGGVIAGLTALAAERANHGHRTTIVSLDSPQAFDPASLPFDWVGLGPGRGKYRYTPRLSPWLTAHARDFDAVTIHGLWQWHSYGAWRTLRRLGVPYLAFTHGMLAPWFRSRYPLKHLKKWLYWPWADYRVLRDAATVCFTSEEERILARSSFSLYQAREEVVGFGISTPPPAHDQQLEDFRTVVPAATGKRVLLFLSRIHEVKGCDLLIRAFARTLAKDPAWHLVIAGPDQDGLGPGLRQLAEHHGLGGRLSWPGMLTGDAKWGAFRSAEVFCLPSHQECFGVVVAEALACSCPVLISNQVNIWREVEASACGLVEPDTEDGCASLLRNWQQLAPPQVRAMRREASAAFSRHFHISAASANIYAAMAKMPGQHGISN